MAWYIRKHSFYRIYTFLLILAIQSSEGIDSRNDAVPRVMIPQPVNENRKPVEIISKSDFRPLLQQHIQLASWTEHGLKPMPMRSYYRKKKVDTEKFRECIFFQLCSKAQCFHFGRYNKCSF